MSGSYSEQYLQTKQMNIFFPSLQIIKTKIIASFLKDVLATSL